MANIPDIKQVKLNFSNNRYFSYAKIDFSILISLIIHFLLLLQIAAKHYDVYEAYYRSLDPKNTNQIGALDAAKFLKKSGLSDVILSRVS